MDSSSIAHMANIFNPTCLTSSSSSSVCTKPKMLTICAHSMAFFLHQRSFSSSLVAHCSTKRNIDRDNTTDENPTVESSLDLNSQFQVTPASNETVILSSSLSNLRGLVFGLGSLGSWDDAEIGSPVVKRFKSDDEERWYMWYHGKSSNENDKNSSSSLIGLAISNNGVHWERGNGAVKSSTDVGLVMKCSDDWWAFDTQSIMPSEVVIMSSSKVRVSSAVYWLFYTGFSSKIVDTLSRNDLGDENVGGGKVLKSLPGLAISQDGRHWARIEGEHHSGALLEMGSEQDWDSAYIASPQVVYHKSGDLRMYYHSYDTQKCEYAIGMARSRDGMKWVKLGKILGASQRTNSFDQLGAMNARVARNKKDGNYIMAYEGVGCDGKKSIGLAISADGLKEWRRLGDEAILKTSSMGDDWDFREIGSPCLVHMEGDKDEWRLYYSGVGNGGKTGIGMAVCDGSDLTCFTRWTGFH